MNLCRPLEMRRTARWRDSFLCAFLSFALLPVNVPAQTQQKPDISVDVKLVNVIATVRDKKGDIVKNLTKDDFALTEDSRPQTITYFSQETDLPLTLGLLVDTSGSQRSVLDQERSASHTFVDQMIREDRDRAFLIHFDREVELLQDLTPSRTKLESALDLLNASDDNNGNGGQGGGLGGGQGGGPGRGGRGRGFSGGGTLLYDAIYLASNELMKNQKGRKALVILTDGVDHGSKESLETAIESAQRADTLVYCILFEGQDRGNYGGRHGGFGGPRIGMGGPGIGFPYSEMDSMGSSMTDPQGGGRYPREEGEDGKKVLEKIAGETGAHLFEVSKKLPIDKIYSQIEEELRNEYSIGYTPDKADSGYHKISVTMTKQKGLVVQARDGYYGN